MDKKSIGYYYESLAVNYLTKKCGYKILERNYRTKFGEIDIVAVDKKNNTIVFTEVRYRKDNSYGSPKETVSFYKQKRIGLTALLYIKSCLDKKYKNFSFRFDIISFTEAHNIEHIKNAFELNIPNVVL